MLVSADDDDNTPTPGIDKGDEKDDIRPGWDRDHSGGRVDWSELEGGSSGDNGNTPPDVDGNNPHYGGNNPNGDGNNPHYGGNNPNGDDNNPHYGENNPNGDGNNPHYGENNPNGDGNNPHYGGNNPGGDGSNGPGGHQQIAPNQGGDGHGSNGPGGHQQIAPDQSGDGHGSNGPGGYQQIAPDQGGDGHGSNGPGGHQQIAPDQGGDGHGSNGPGGHQQIAPDQGGDGYGYGDNPKGNDLGEYMQEARSGAFGGASSSTFGEFGDNLDRADNLIEGMEPYTETLKALEESIENPTDRLKTSQLLGDAIKTPFELVGSVSDAVSDTVGYAIDAPLEMADNINKFKETAGFKGAQKLTSKVKRMGTEGSKQLKKMVKNTPETLKRTTKGLSQSAKGFYNKSTKGAKNFYKSVKNAKGPAGKTKTALGKSWNKGKDILKTTGKFAKVSGVVSSVSAVSDGFQAVKDFSNGDHLDGAGNTAGALGGGMMAVAPFTGPAAPIVGGIGLAATGVSLAIEHRDKIKKGYNYVKDKGKEAVDAVVEKGKETVKNTVDTVKSIGKGIGSLFS